MSKQNPEIDAYYEWIDPLFRKILLHKTYEEYPELIADLPRQELAIFAAHCCDAEIGNGGFDQLFYNPTGILVPESFEGYIAVGKPELEAIVRKAAKLLGEPYPRGREERQETLLVLSGRTLPEVEEIAKEAKHPYLGFLKAVEDLDLDELSSEYYQQAICQRWFFDEAASSYIAGLRTND